MTGDHINIRPGRFEDIPRLAHLLARAFYRDPVYRWLVPDDSRRISVIQRISLGFLHTAYRCETLFVIDGLEGVALWLPPAPCSASWKDEIRRDLRIVRVLGRYMYRGVLWWWFLERHHPAYPHWVLFLLGVEPERQGKGFGSALVRHMLARIDKEQVPIYLDTGNPSNVPFYEHMGFEVTRTVNLPGGPVVFQMVRQPKG